jgi:hypothetical protein
MTTRKADRAVWYEKRYENIEKLVDTNYPCINTLAAVSDYFAKDNLS